MKLFGLLTRRKAPPRIQPDTAEIAAAQVSDRHSGYPSNGLTPAKLAKIFRAADTGDVLSQMELFEEMEEKDPHLFSQLQTRKTAVTGLDYEIVPFSDDERDKEIAAFVAREIESLENLEDVMMDLLDAIGKGIAVCEIMWDCNNSKVTATDIRHRHQKRFLWDAHDNLRVVTPEHSQGIILPDNKFIVHRYKARSGHPARAGVLRVVAWMYLFKNYDLKDWVSFCEVYGMPLRLGKYAQGASDEDKAALMRALVQIGADAAGIVPEGTSIDFKEASKTSSSDVYERLARYCDEQVSKAILGQTLTSDAGGGSYAQSKTHNEVRHDLTAADCKALAATLRRDLIRPLVLFNFHESRRIPYIRYDCEESDDLREAADILDILISRLGLRVPSSYIYKKFSIPKPESGEEVAMPSGGAANPLPTGHQPSAADRQYASDTLSLKEEIAAEAGTQARIDAVAQAAISCSTHVFEKMLAPILESLDSTGSLDKMGRLLEDDRQAGQLMGRMDTKGFDKLLWRAMMLADLEGRVNDNA